MPKSFFLINIEITNSSSPTDRLRLTFLCNLVFI